MEAIQTAISALEQELEVLDDRRGEIEHAIGAMRKLVPASTNGKAARTNKQTKQGAGRPTRRSLPNRDRAIAAAPGSGPITDVVTGRDHAILARLRKGSCAKAELIAAMPPEADKTPSQRAADCSNALTRLRLKKHIKQVDEGWAIA